jgi:hypothetical protein
MEVCLCLGMSPRGLTEVRGFMEVCLCLGMSPRGLTEVRGFHGSLPLPRYVSAGGQEIGYRNHRDVYR